MSDRAPIQIVVHLLAYAHPPRHATGHLSRGPSNSGGPGASSCGDILCPDGAGERINDAFHGLRWLEDSLASPVATTPRPFGAEHNPSGVEGGGAASAADAPVRARDFGAAGRGGGDGLKRPPRPAAQHAALASQVQIGGNDDL